MKKLFARMAEEVFELYSSLDKIRISTFSHDGAKFAAGCGKYLKVWCSYTLTILGTITAHSANIKNIVFTSDDSRIITRSQCGFVRFWDASTLRSVGGAINNPRSRYMTISPDDKLLATIDEIGSENIITIWNISDCKFIKSIKIPYYDFDSLFNIEFGFTNDCIIVTDCDFGYGIDIKTEKKNYTIASVEQYTQNKYGRFESYHNGKYLINIITQHTQHTSKDTIQIFKSDLFSNQLISEVELEFRANRMHLSADATKLVIICSQTRHPCDHIIVYDIVKHQIINHICSEYYEHILISPDNSMLVLMKSHSIKIIYNPCKTVSGSCTKMALK